MFADFVEFHFDTFAQTVVAVFVLARFLDLYLLGVHPTRFFETARECNVLRMVCTLFVKEIPATKKHTTDGNEGRHAQKMTRPREEKMMSHPCMHLAKCDQANQNLAARFLVETFETDGFSLVKMRRHLEIRLHSIFFLELLQAIQ